jgi:DNA/RNA endonuclease YhcR with UshA esterase domain
MVRAGSASVSKLTWMIAVVFLSSSALFGDDPPKKPGKKAKPPTSAPSTQPTPRKVRIGEIDKAMVGQVVSVRGTVERITERPSKTREKIVLVTLADGDDHILLIYWADVARKIPAEQVPAEGDRLRVVGKVAEFRNRLEIVLNDPADLRKLKKKTE